MMGGIKKADFEMSMTGPSSIPDDQSAWGKYYRPKPKANKTRTRVRRDKAQPAVRTEPRQIATDTVEDYALDDLTGETQEVKISSAEPHRAVAILEPLFNVTKGGVKVEILASEPEAITSILDRLAQRYKISAAHRARITVEPYDPQQDKRFDPNQTNVGQVSEDVRNSVGPGASEALRGLT